MTVYTGALNPTITPVQGIAFEDRYDQVTGAGTIQYVKGEPSGLNTSWFQVSKLGAYNPGPFTFPVASDGSVEFTTVQAAIDAAVASGLSEAKILVYPGAYGGSTVVPPSAVKITIESAIPGFANQYFAATIADLTIPANVNLIGLFVGTLRVANSGAINSVAFGCFFTSLTIDTNSAFIMNNCSTNGVGININSGFCYAVDCNIGADLTVENGVLAMFNCAANVGKATINTGGVVQIQLSSFKVNHNDGCTVNAGGSFNARDSSLENSFGPALFTLTDFSAGVAIIGGSVSVAPGLKVAQGANGSVNLSTLFLFSSDVDATLTLITSYNTTPNPI